MMAKNAHAFVVIEESVMVFKHTKDKGLIPITEGFLPLKEGFLKNFKSSFTFRLKMNFIILAL
ncbi:hypothetical protein TH0950_14940 [Helicobacter pylori]